MSFPISNPEVLSAFIEISCYFFHTSPKIEEDMVMATSMTAPKDPINNPAINTIR